MDIKKALKLTAIGYLFTLVNFNLNFNGGTLNIMPEFIGWILLFLAFDHYGDYGRGKQWLKWTALVLAVVFAAFWVINIMDSNMQNTTQFSTLKSATSLASAVYSFFMFDILETVAADISSSQTGRISFLKYFNAGIYVVMIALAFVAQPGNVQVIAWPILIVGTAALVAAIITVIALFRLSKEAGRLG